MPLAIRRSLLPAAIVLLLSACGGSNRPTPVPDPPVIEQPASTLSPALLAQIDDYMVEQMRRQQIPGATIVVVRDGKPALQKGYGSANLGTGAAAGPHTVFRIGSVTKQFTASAIMLLVQDGRLQLDQPLSQLLPGTPAAWSAITVRHLLTHTSGLQRDFPLDRSRPADPAQFSSIERIVALAASVPLSYPTGARLEYSNMGYNLLGQVIEKVSGQDYAAFLKVRVFDPLGMASADSIHTTRPVPAMAAGYTWNGTAIQPASTHSMIPGLIGAAGALQMSAADLAKWDAALDGERILTPASLAQMWTPTRLNDGTTVPYGFGWALSEINHLPFVQHDGRVEGFVSQFARHGKEGFSVIVLANTDSASTERLTSRISSLLDPRVGWATAPDPRPQTGAELRAILDEVARGTLRPDDRFTPAFRAQLTPESLQGSGEYLRALGAFEQFAYLDQVGMGGLMVARYLARSRYEQAVFGIAYDSEGRIAYLGLVAE